MSNFSRTACSLAPAYFHHWRSKSSMAASRLDSSPEPSGWGLLTAGLATIVGAPRRERGGVALIIGEEIQRCHLVLGVARGAPRVVTVGPWRRSAGACWRRDGLPTRSQLTWPWSPT